MLKIYSKETDLTNIIAKSRKAEGFELRETHKELGRIIGKDIFKELGGEIDNVSIVFIMRAGLYMAEGISEYFHDAPYIPVRNSFELAKFRECLEGRTVILVDAVINTGGTIIPIIEQLNIKNKVIVATNVIFEDTVNKLNNCELRAIRVSTNSYVGTKGKDTGNKLFNTCEIA